MSTSLRKPKRQEGLHTVEPGAWHLINMAFAAIDRELTYLEDALFAVLINEAVSEGLTCHLDIAWRALELGGGAQGGSRRVLFHTSASPCPVSVSRFTNFGVYLSFGRQMLSGDWP
jgi:hypothetical protein